MLVTTLLSNGSSLYSSGSVLVVLLLLRLLLVAYFFVDFPESDLVFDFFVGTGLAAVFINLSVENFAGWKFALTFAIIQKSYFAGFIVYLLINLVLVFSSAYIITQFAPAAAGSGIPEIKGYLNGIDIPGTLLFRTLIGKIFGSIGSVGGGLALGKEGPLVHTGACIASLLGQGGSTKYHLNSRWPQLFKSDRDRRDLVTCGCAAGVAAAFRAPVGGVLFALEEVTSWWRSQLMWRVFFTSAIVAVVVRTAMGWCKSGICGHFGGGGFIIWDVSE
jgi:chloride channel 7